MVHDNGDTINTKNLSELILLMTEKKTVANICVVSSCYIVISLCVPY